MNISICLIGFIRDINHINNLTKFINNINNSNLNSVTVFYSCPSKIEETDDNNFNEDYILNLFKNQENNIIKMNISFRNYNKQMFVDKTNELMLPYITSTNYHSYRVLSCLHSFSETAKLVNNENYNFIIFSRLDLIHYILSINKIFDNNTILTKSAYVWRTFPYISSGDVANHVEDRFFICSNDCISFLKNSYDVFLNKLDIKENLLVNEIILGKIFNMHLNIQKYHLHNIIVHDELNEYTSKRIQIKYSNKFLENM